MKMPTEARPRFDHLLTQPLEKTTLHKREVHALLTQLEGQNDTPPQAVVATRLAAILLDRMERKTSPLYVRLIHAAARFVTDDITASMDAANWSLRKEVVWSVAHSTKHFDLVGAEPDATATPAASRRRR